jgi:cellulose synthase operon protein C
MRTVQQICALVLAVAALAIGTARGAESDAFTAAAEHYRNARWQQACDAFAQLLESDPQFARRSDAHFFYGEALVQLDRWQEARPHFAQVLEIDNAGPRAQQSLFRVGEAAYMIGDDAAAQRDLAAFHGRHPDDPLNAYGLAYLGGLALQANQTAEAEKWFSASLARYADGPMAAESQFGLAQSLHQSDQLEKARDAYRRVIDGGGELAATSLLQVGAIENELGDHAAALAAFDDFARRFPQSELTDKVQLGRGYALLKLERPQDAQRVLAPLAAKPEMQLEGSYYLALAQAAEGQWQGAAQTLSQLKLDPQHALAPAVAFYKADALSHSGDVEAARAQFDRVLQDYGASTWADDSLLGKLRLAVEQKDSAASLQLADELLSRYPDSPLAAQAKLAKGQALAMIDKPAEAVAALKSLLETDAAAVPGAEEIRARAQGILAVSQAKLGQFEEAQKALTELASSPDAAAIVNEAKLRVGELAQAAGEKPLAQEMLAGVVDGSTKVASRARSSLAWNEFEAGRWSEAAAAFQQVLDSNVEPPVAAEAALLRGRALEHLKQSDDALAMYEQVLARYPETTRAPEATLCAARLHEQLGNADEARRTYAALIEKYPDYAGLDEALYRNAWLLRSSDPAGANQLFERIRSEFATSPYAGDATLRLAEAAIEKHDFDAAAPLLREITRPDAPADVRPAALYLEGRMQMVRGEWVAAQKPLEQLIKEHADSDLVLPAEYLQAEAAFRQGDFEGAVERFRVLLDKAAGRTDAWLPTAELRRAQALAQLRRWDEASQIAQTLATRYPNFGEAYEADYLVGRAFAAQANFDAAREWYAKAIAGAAAAGSETAAMAQWMLGESYFHQEKYSEALAEYLRVDEQSPRWHGAALLQAGKAEEALGHWQAAADRYQKLLEQYPDGQLSAEATRRLGAARERAASQPTARK